MTKTLSPDADKSRVDSTAAVFITTYIHHDFSKDEISLVTTVIEGALSTLGSLLIRAGVINPAATV
jgi:hypothetical protein